ncbi:MAG: hypothetical protein Q9169_008348 [Polycauliona sp. 2 TL-2023]
MRGKDHIYLLCKSSACINILDLVREVWSEGSIDIAILGLAVHHMLPCNLSTPPFTAGGNVDLEFAGFALSYRPASRKGDDLVIWALLIGLDKSSTAPLPFEGEDQESEVFATRFWRTFVHGHIATGFLMTSAPRLTTLNFTWAPRTASCLPTDRYGLVHSFYEGATTALARIADQGIVGDWMMYEFDVETVQTVPLDTFTSPLNRRLKEICEIHLRQYSRGALIHPVTEQVKNTSVSLIQEGDQRRAESATPFERLQSLEYPGYQGQVGGTLVAILGAGNFHTRQEQNWSWREIYHWTSSHDFPPFKLVPNLLIS